MLDVDLEDFVDALRRALLAGDVVFLLEHYDLADVAEFQARVLEAAALLRRVGGAAALLRRLQVTDLVEAAALSPLAFVQRFTGLQVDSLPMTDAVEVLSVEQRGDTARLVTRTEVRFDDEDDENEDDDDAPLSFEFAYPPAQREPFVVDREHALVRRPDGWRIRFALGALEDALNLWIDDAQELERRAVLDRTTRLARITSDDELEPVAVHGFADESGVVLIQPRFRAVQPFSEGLAAVQFIEHWGYIDRTGRVVIEPRFAAAKRFSAGSAAVSLDGEAWGLIDRAGHWIAVPDGPARG